ncbi:MAG: DNA topoisomerase III [Peptococcaceae bacterium]|nr:DNA topoisomerase III [Peptococcaceae bacterium]
MTKSLILAEKPSVGRELARVLGVGGKHNGYFESNRYIVTWALGHLVTLADPEHYGEEYKAWRMDTLPMLPHPMDLVVIPQSGKQFRTVSGLMKRKDVSEIIIATDAGREGELVARWIIEKARVKKPMRRLWISSQTDQAIRQGFAHLEPAAKYDNLYYSAQARSEADWVVGFNTTRALTCRYNAQLSAGRVQTPTLAMIVQRERAIRDFKSQPYYEVQAKVDGMRLLWQGQDKRTRFSNRETPARIVSRCNKQDATVAGLESKRKHTAPPLLYDLTTLQREANARYGFSAKETLSYMQRLYEEHKLLTYPRTDSRYLTKDIVATFPERLQALTSNGYGELTRQIRAENRKIANQCINDKGVSDHHAIIPTEERLSKHSLSSNERRIYEMVVKRFLANFLGDYTYEQTRVHLDVAGEDFTCHGNVTVDLGWKAVETLTLDDTDEEDLTRNSHLPRLSQGQVLHGVDVSLREGQTKPPARFTEGSLLAAMENPQGFVRDKHAQSILHKSGGIGTPATRADIIEKLFKSFYIEKQGQSLVPTSKGIQLIDIVPQALTSPLLTAQWEERLEGISHGQEKAAHFASDMRAFATELVRAVADSDKQYRHDNLTRTQCPECGKFMLEVNTKKGKMLVCQDRECGYRRNLSQTTNARCPKCHKRLTVVGDGDKRLYTCTCGFREKFDRFNKQLKEKRNTSSKRDVQNYMRKQKKEENIGASAMADAWAKALNKEK